MAPPPRVFLDIQIGVQPAGRIVIELYAHTTPQTCENFRLLCTGTAPPITLPTCTTLIPLCYKGNTFHRVVEEFMIQGGDITRGDGTGGHSALGKPMFDDEKLGWREMDEPGLVCMANRGPNTNSSQFFITLAECKYLTQKHTVVGKVVKGMDIVEMISNVSVDEKDRPVEDVIIVRCGELVFQKKDKEEESKGEGKEKEKEDTEDRGKEKERDRHRDRENGHRRHHHHRHHRRRSASPRDDDDKPRSRGRSRTPTASRSPEQHKRRYRDRSPSPRRRRDRSRSPRRYGRSKQYDGEEMERIEREEREREAARSYDDVYERPPNDAGVKFKGRGSMKYRERKTWGGGNSYGRLD